MPHQDLSPAQSTPQAAPEAASNAVFLVIAAALALVALGTLLWGLPVLALSALAMVPVIFTLLMLVTRG